MMFCVPDSLFHQLIVEHKPIGATPRKQCIATAGGSTIFCIVWYILLYLDRLQVVLIEGGLLHGDSSITVAGFDVIPPQALKIPSTPCCSHIGYMLLRYIGRYVSTRDQHGNLMDAINGICN